MIIPSIDLQGGAAVQLIGGKERAIDAGDPRPILDRFARVGEVAVIDLDAAMSSGNNRERIAELCRSARCRVGGGIRDIETARFWLNAGAVKIIIGTAAERELLLQLPRDRVLVALDAVDGEVVTKGWAHRTGRDVFDRISELRDCVGGFLITIVEREGRMSGIDLNHVQKLADACAGTPLTIAGGVRDAEEIAQLDSMGVDAQVGMALYTGAFDLADALGACLNSDRADGLWPTIVANERGAALGLVYSSLESLRAALQEGAGVYHSRSRGLWRKGETSGNRQILKAVDLDCDRDALRFTVQQQGNGFCHTGSQTCFGSLSGLAQLEATLAARARAAPASSYTGRLLSDPALLAQKLREECGELIDARSKLDIAWEAADMLYFTLTRMRAGGVTLRDVERELDRRSLAMTRRGGEAKSEVR